MQTDAQDAGHLAADRARPGVSSVGRWHSLIAVFQLRWLIVVVVLAAVFLRAYQVGDPSWHQDEAFHVFAAESLNEVGTPVLPGGRVYTRSPILTWTSSKLFEFFGVSETVGRAPGVVLGSLAVLLLYLFSRRYVGREVALLAAALLALSPFAITLSRFLRYYAELQVFSIVIVFLSIGFLRRSYALRLVPRLARRLPARAWVIGALSLAAVAASALLGKSGHPLILSLFPAMLFVVGLRFLLTVSRGGALSAVKTTDFVLLATVAAILAGAVLFFTGEVKRYYWIASMSSGFAAENVGDNLYYLKVLWRDYPLFPIFVGMGTVWLCVKRGSVGALIASSFWLPLLIMSTVLAFRVDRFMTFLLPMYFVLFSYGVYQTFSLGRRLLQRAPLAPGAARSRWIPTALGAAAIAAYLVMVPWPARIHDVITRPDNVYEGISRGEMRQSLAELKPKVRGDDIVVADAALVVWHYLGRPVDYVFAPSFANVADQSGAHYSGAERIVSAADFEAVVNRHCRGWVVTSTIGTRDDPPETSRGLKEVIRSATRAEMQGRFPTVSIRSWGPVVNGRDEPTGGCPTPFFETIPSTDPGAS